MVLMKRLRIYYDRFISLKGEPASIAAGFAIGVFVGVTPTIPFHTAMIVFLALVFRQNITAAYLGTWLISNPLTIPLLYLSQYQLGRFLLGIGPHHLDLTDYSLSAIAAAGWQVLLPLLSGGIIMAPFFAVPAYYLSRRLISAARAKGGG
jgi:uncharacterized protein